MNNEQRATYVTRDSILNLLSDDEVARVSNAASAPRLREGDEFLDLDALPRGVQRAHGRTELGGVLPRNAVHEDTWSKILTQLESAVKDTGMDSGKDSGKDFGAAGGDSGADSGKNTRRNTVPLAP